MPPLLCNRKLDTPVVAMKVKHLHGCATVVLHSNQQWRKHFHGYAHVTVLLGCIATNIGRWSVSIGAARDYKGKATDNS
jgi:hypothetical protein